VARRLVASLLVLAASWGGLAFALSMGLRPALGLDLQGGISVILSAPDDATSDQMDQVVEVMRRRIESSGVQEPEISVQGETAILVQLPGVTDTDAALAIVGQTGQLSFRPVLAVANPADVELGTGDRIDEESWLASNEGVAYLVGPSALLGTDLSEAVAAPGPTGAYAVNLSFTSEGADKFASLTAQAASFPLGDVRRQIAIVLDGIVINAPPVAADVSPITGISGGQAVITLGSGDDVRKEAEDLAIVLRYGALPVELERQSLQQVSATLGQHTLRAGVVAGLSGLAVVALLLVVVYRALGLIAVAGLAAFGALLMLVFIALGQWVGLTFTLAGVTGVIVSIGIAADSNIVYYERVKDFVRQGMAVDEAATHAFTRSFRTILTAGFVSIVGALLLWLLAIGPVKGFAVALGIAAIVDLAISRWFMGNAVIALANSRMGKEGFWSIAALPGAEPTPKGVAS
jgi:preprotein translocase subunit SecD